jgi:hypothetical protein
VERDNENDAVCRWRRRDPERFGVAFAGEDEAVVPNAQFTRIAGVVEQGPAQKVTPVAMAADAPSAHSYATRSYHGTWLFHANETGGGPNG